MKRCRICGQCKPLGEFDPLDKSRPERTYAACKDCEKARLRQRYTAARRWIREYAVGWRQDNRQLMESANRFVNESGQQEFRLPPYYHHRHAAILAYGGYRCACCGTTEAHFLTIDHVNNDGASHRRLVGGYGLFRWLEDNGYPPGFQVLCSNCNSGRHRNGGICPHKDPVPKPGKP